MRHAAVLEYTRENVLLARKAGCTPEVISLLCGVNEFKAAGQRRRGRRSDGNLRDLVLAAYDTNETLAQTGARLGVTAGCISAMRWKLREEGRIIGHKNPNMVRRSF